MMRKIKHLLIVLALVSITAFSSAALLKADQNQENVALSRFPHGTTPLSAYGATSATALGEIGEEHLNTISVSGTGSASMRADEAIVTLGVQTEDELASEAVRFNAELMSDVVDAIKALGISEDDMKTVSYNVYPVYEKRDYTDVVAYRTVNMIDVKVTDLDLLGTLIDEATEAGSDKVERISFGLSDEEQERLMEEAYISALDDAEGKANLIAERLGLDITGVLYVSESIYQPYSPYYDYRLEGGALVVAEASTPILEGDLSVSVTVQIIYSFSQ